MKKILIVGGYHVDMTMTGPKIPGPGEIVVGTHFNAEPGGIGLNQAITVSRLGGDEFFLAKVGSDIFGEDAIGLFEQEGMDTTCVKVDETTHTGVRFTFVDIEGRNTVSTVPGANYHLSAEDLREYSSLFDMCEILLIQLETPLLTVYEAISMANRAGATVVLNPAPIKKIDPKILPMVDILTMNEAEAEILSNMAVPDRKSAMKAGKVLLSQGVKFVIINLGSDGVVLVSHGEEGHFPSYKVDVVDLAGVGDAFNGGLAYGLAVGKRLEESVDFASKVSALTATKAGIIPALPRMRDVEEHFGKV